MAGEEKGRNFLQHLDEVKQDVEFELRGSDFNISKILDYIAKLPEEGTSKVNVGEILAQQDPNIRKEMIGKLVKKAFTKETLSFSGWKTKLKANEEVISFFAEFLEEQMIAKNERDQRIMEVVSETRKLLGDAKAHTQSSYMNETGKYFKKEGIKEFEKGKDKEKAILDYTDPENVFSYLADIRGTGDLSSPENKKGVVTAQGLDSLFKSLGGKPAERRVLTVTEKENMKKSGILEKGKGIIGEEFLLKNICQILGQAMGTNISFQTKEQLLDYIKTKPEARARFIDFVEQRARMGIDLNQLFTAPTTALKRTMDIKDEIEQGPLLNKSLEVIGKMIEGKLDKEIQEFEKKIAAANGPQKEAMQKALEYIKEPANKKSIIDNFKVRAGGGFFSWMRDHHGFQQVRQNGDTISVIRKNKSYKSLLFGMDIGSDDLDAKIKEYTKIFDHLDIDIGVGVANGKPHIGIGAHLSGEVRISRDFAANYVTGTYLLVPYILGGVDYLTNSGSLESLKGMVGKELDIKSAFSVGMIGNLSFAGAGGGFYISRDKLRGIETKKQYFDKMMDKICKAENINKNHDQLFSELKAMPEGKSLKDDDQQSLKVILEDIQKTIATLPDFNSLDPKQKQNFIERNLKKAFVNRWHEKALVETEKDGWYLGGIFGGVNIWWGFLPTFSILPDFKKVVTEWKPNPESQAMNIGKKITGAGTFEIPGETLDGFASRIQNLIDVNSGGKSDVHTENGKLVISMKAGGDPLDYISNIRYNPAVKNQIKYDGKQIILGDVKTIVPYYESKSKTSQIGIYVGGMGEYECSQKINRSNKDEASKEFGNTNPGAMPAMSSAGGAETGKINVSSEFIDKDLGEYLKQNTERFLGFVWRHEGTYPHFMNAYSKGDYPKATNYLIKMLSSDRALRNDNKIKDVISKLNLLKSAKPGTPDFENLAIAVNQITNITMVDVNTSDKIKSPEQRKSQADRYIDNIFGNKASINVGGKEFKKAEISAIATSCLENSANFEAHRSMFKELFGYQKNQSIIQNSAKRLYYLLRPVTDFYSERKGAFEQMAKKEGLNTSTIETYRKRAFDALASGKGGWGTTVLDGTMGLFASYKLNQSNTQRLFSGFGFTHGGVTEIATNLQTGTPALVDIDENDIAAKTWTVERIMKQPGAKIAQSLSKLLGVKLNDNDAKTLLINGSINIGGNSYTIKRGLKFGLYGPCANEGLFLTLNEISTPRGSNKITLGFGGDMETQIVTARTINLIPGASALPLQGEEKKTRNYHMGKPLEAPKETPKEEPKKEEPKKEEPKKEEPKQEAPKETPKEEPKPTEKCEDNASVGAKKSDTATEKDPAGLK